MDQLIGLLLLGLGIYRKPAVNPNIRGDATSAAQQTGTLPESGAFRLDPKNFELRPLDSASSTGAKRQVLDTHAFGTEITRVQRDFILQVEVSSKSAQQVFASHAAQLRTQLATVVNIQKQETVERISANCQNVNVKRTQKMSEMLETLSGHLTKISDRAASASAAGKDTAGVESAITTAQTAIADAQLSVTAQAAKTCIIRITTESNVKTDVGKTISTLEADLAAVYAKVKAAKKTVSDAIVALSRVTGESLTPQSTPRHASPSGNQPG